MRGFSRISAARTGGMVLLAGLMLNGCASPTGLDWDLRSGGGFDTSDAARQATAAPPRADARGLVSYPDYQVAVAQRGDTVASVAARIGMQADDLARFNALKPTDSLRAGEVLALPGRGAGAAAPQGTGGVIGSGTVDVSAIATTALDRVGSEAPAPGARPAAVAQGTVPVQHRVARGETAFSIARSYNVSARALADWNGLGPDLAVREGQVLLIPTAAATGAPPAVAAASPAPGQGSPTPEPPSAKQPLPEEKPARASEKPKDTPPSPDLAAGRTGASATRLAMPVAGKIIRGYVKQKNDGIDIAAAPGTPVTAAADGTVAAITKDTGGTPIVVLRHEGNLLTVYAGVDAVTLAKGAAVKRGQTIAAVRAGDPAFLHFEVRNGVESVDPMPYLQ